MQVRVASEADNPKLKQFFESFSISSIADFKITRGNDFFGLYRAQSNEYRTYLLEDKGEVFGLASFVIKECLLNGELVKVAIASDLRVSPTRKAIIEWTNHFLPAMNEVQKDFQVSHFFSIINFSEHGALNTFIRPRNIKRPLPRYYLYRKFDLITLHGKFTWAPKPLQHVRIREASEANIDSLVQYLINRSVFKPFSTIWNFQSLRDKLAKLGQTKFSDFLIAFDANDKIVGCLSSVSTSKYQQHIPMSYSMRAHNFRQFLKFAQVLGWTRPLSKPFSTTGIENPMKYRLLNHIFASNEDIFESLLWNAYERADKNEFLAYAQIQQDYRLLPPSSWISTRQPYALYSIVPPEQPMPGFLSPNEVLNPEVEILF